MVFCLETHIRNKEKCRPIWCGHILIEKLIKWRFFIRFPKVSNHQTTQYTKFMNQIMPEACLKIWENYESLQKPFDVEHASVTSHTL